MTPTEPLGLQSLAAMAHVLAASHPLTDLLEIAADRACEALAAATVSISRVEADRDLVRTVINVGDLAPGEVRHPVDETYPIVGDRRLMSAMDERKSWVDSITDPDCDDNERDLLELLGKGCSLSVAIVVDGRTWGEFYATRHVGAPVFDDDAVAYAEVVVAILAAAVERTIREAALEDLAFHDPLTGLFNRRALDQHSAKLFDSSNLIASCPVAVVAVDINGLKRVNDTEGHAEGDQAIRAVATTLRKAFGALSSSLVARVGGDEFTIMVSGDDVARVEATINWVCHEVRTKSHRVELSAGIAFGEVGPGWGSVVTDLLVAADQAQYVAKRRQMSVAAVADRVAD